MIRAGRGQAASFNLDEIELIQGWSASDPHVRARFAFPLHVASGSCSSGLVYMELEPGDNCGRHWDSAEEVFLVRQGVAELEIGGQRVRLTAGGVAMAPPLMPHNVRNLGDQLLKIVGFFPSGAVVARHDDRIEPLGLTDLVVPNPDEVPGTAP